MIIDETKARHYLATADAQEELKVKLNEMFKEIGIDWSYYIYEMLKYLNVEIDQQLKGIKIVMRPIDIEDDMYGIYYEPYGYIEFYDTPNVAILWELDIKNEYRGTGIAEALMDYLEKYLTQKGVARILSPTTIHLETILTLETLGFHGCEQDDITGIEELKRGVPPEKNIKQYNGLIDMCKDIQEIKEGYIRLSDKDDKNRSEKYKD